jgi:hypothetical protein
MIHHLEVQVWSRRITRMTNICQPLAWKNLFSFGDQDRAGLGMSVDSIPVTAFDDDKVTRQRSQVRSLLRIDSPGILEKEEKIPQRVDRIPLRPAILSPNYDPSRGREDGLSPTKAILQTNAEDEVTKKAGSTETHSQAFWIYADEIIGVPLAKQVGPVAWGFRAGSVGGHPYAPERKVSNNWSEHMRAFSRFLTIDSTVAHPLMS